VSRDQVR